MVLLSIPLNKLPDGVCCAEVPLSEVKSTVKMPWNWKSSIVASSQKVLEGFYFSKKIFQISILIYYIQYIFKNPGSTSANY